MAVLALDLGARRVGVAVNDVGAIVLPLTTIDAGSIDELATRIGLLVQERSATTVVVGRPRAGSETEQLLVKLADRLAGVEIVQLDEALTSKEAERRLAGQGGGGDTDAVAAQLILEQYLAERSRP